MSIPVVAERARAERLVEATLAEPAAAPTVEELQRAIAERDAQIASLSASSTTPTCCSRRPRTSWWPRGNASRR